MNKNTNHTYIVTILGIVGERIVTDAIVCTCGEVVFSLDSEPYMAGARHNRLAH
jgi:hypothetical protein